MAASTAVRKLETGIPGFDVISHGGIPKGRSSLIVGRSGTGKTILGLQIAAHTAGRASRPCSSPWRSRPTTSLHRRQPGSGPLRRHRERDASRHRRLPAHWKARWW